MAIDDYSVYFDIQVAQEYTMPDEKQGGNSIIINYYSKALIQLLNELTDKLNCQPLLHQTELEMLQRI